MMWRRGYYGVAVPYIGTWYVRVGTKNVPTLPGSKVGLFLPPLLFFMTLLFLPNIIGYTLPHIHDAFMRAALADYAGLFSPVYRIFCLQR